MNEEKGNSYSSHVGFEPVTSLGLAAKKLAKINFTFFLIIKIPPISTSTDKYIFVADITEDKMYMIRNE